MFNIHQYRRSRWTCEKYQLLDVELLSITLLVCCRTMMKIKALLGKRRICPLTPTLLYTVLLKETHFVKTKNPFFNQEYSWSAILAKINSFNWCLNYNGQNLIRCIKFLCEHFAPSLANNPSARLKREQGFVASLVNAAVAWLDFRFVYRPSFFCFFFSSGPTWTHNLWSLPCICLLLSEFRKVFTAFDHWCNVHLIFSIYKQTLIIDEVLDGLYYVCGTIQLYHFW